MKWNDLEVDLPKGDELISLCEKLNSVQDIPGHKNNMKIFWIPCSELMPPRDRNCKVIVKCDDDNLLTDGEWANKIACKLWTPYTEQAWKGLNKS